MGVGGRGSTSEELKPIGRNLTPADEPVGNLLIGDIETGLLQHFEDRSFLFLLLLLFFFFFLFPEKATKEGTESSDARLSNSPKAQSNEKAAKEREREACTLGAGNPASSFFFFSVR